MSNERVDDKVLVNIDKELSPVDGERIHSVFQRAKAIQKRLGKDIVFTFNTRTYTVKAESADT
jgi:queuine/archaeosine tRNA-ribosyltransferase